MRNLALFAICLLLGACAQTVNDTPPPSTAEKFAPSRPALNRQDCLDAGGLVVGDIGDGRIHRQDYACPNGQSPIGTIIYGKEEAMPLEGEVCCASE
jgi:hypothetical protein